MYGICKLSLVPLREASSKSEMTSQLLLGDIYQVLSRKEDWIFIEILGDKYTGWINRLQHFELKNISLTLKQQITSALSHFLLPSIKQLI
jgi:hypothetical protein